MISDEMPMPVTSGNYEHLAGGKIYRHTLRVGQQFDADCAFDHL
jgi:hypothetical protein